MIIQHSKDQPTVFRVLDSGLRICYYEIPQLSAAGSQYSARLYIDPQSPYQSWIGRELKKNPSEELVNRVGQPHWATAYNVYYRSLVRKVITSRGDTFYYPVSKQVDNKNNPLPAPVAHNDVAVLVLNKTQNEALERELKNAQDKASTAAAIAFLLKKGFVLDEDFSMDEAVEKAREEGTLEEPVFQRNRLDLRIVRKEGAKPSYVLVQSDKQEKLPPGALDVDLFDLAAVFAPYPDDLLRRAVEGEPVHKLVREFGRDKFPRQESLF